MGVPCIGYSSRMAAVRALGNEGLDPDQIAARTGLRRGEVTTLQWHINRVGARPTQYALSQILPDNRELRLVARRHAAKRGWSTERLVRVIIEKVIEDNIVDAVLDDAAELGRAAR